MQIELLWFEDCPCHERAEQLVKEVLDELGVQAPIERVEVNDTETGDKVVFPGSPTVRVNGVDVEPGWQACPECTPRCRLYQSEKGIGCLPEREWVVEAIKAATGA